MRKYCILIVALLSLISLLPLTGCGADPEKEALTASLSQLTTTVEAKEQESESLQLTISELTGTKARLQGEIASLQAELKLEKSKNNELTQQLQQSQETLTSFEADLSELYNDMVVDYTNYLADHASSPTTTNLVTGETVQSTSPVLSPADKDLLNIWGSDIVKLNELIKD